MDIAAADGLCFPVLYRKIGIRLLHVRVNLAITKKKSCLLKKYIKIIFFKNLFLILTRDQNNLKF
jgi:hypothetical protein